MRSDDGQRHSPDGDHSSLGCFRWRRVDFEVGGIPMTFSVNVRDFVQMSYPLDFRSEFDVGGIRMTSGVASPKTCASVGGSCDRAE